MEMRDINYFAVVAEHRNIRRAAETLGMSQPALSKSLQRLETAMQAKLYERGPAGVRLTTVGRALLAQVHRLQLAFSDIEREAKVLSSGHSGTLRVGTSPVVSECFPAIYAQLMREATAITMEISVTDNDELVPALRKAELDLIYNFLPAAPYEGTMQERVYDDEFVVYSSARHRLASKRGVRLADVAEEAWTLTVPAIASQQWISRAFSDGGLPPPKVAVELRSLRLRLQLCACSNLLGYTSRSVVEGAASRLKLKVLPVAELTWRRPVGVIVRKDSYLLPAAKRFIEILKMNAKEIVAETR